MIHQTVAGSNENGRAVTEIDAFTTPDKIEALEGALLPEEQIELPLNHFFGPGIYIREGFIPKGTLIIGHKHKFACTNVLVKGKMRVVGPDGIPSTIEAPLMFVSGPGRKIGYTLEDCVFQNIHATDETDLEKLEEQLIEKSETWLTFQEAKEAKLLIEGE